VASRRNVFEKRYRYSEHLSIQYLASPMVRYPIVIIYFILKIYFVEIIGLRAMIRKDSANREQNEQAISLVYCSPETIEYAGVS
jgi:hypothetical protein